MAIKIAVVGTYSSGKTTLVDDLILRHPSMQLLPEHARRAILAGGLDVIRARETRDFLLVANLLDEAEVDGHRGTAISDSGLINNLAHEALFLDPPPDRTGVMSAFHHRAYDAVFWCNPADVALVDDGQRIVDLDTRRRLHVLVGEVLARMRIDPLVLSGTKSERIELANSTVERLIGASLIR